MTVFSSLEAARRYGFRWFDFEADLGLHLVVREDTNAQGLRVRRMALARESDQDAGEHPSQAFGGARGLT